MGSRESDKGWTVSDDERVEFSLNLGWGSERKEGREGEKKKKKKAGCLSSFNRGGLARTLNY